MEEVKLVLIALLIVIIISQLLLYSKRYKNSKFIFILNAALGISIFLLNVIYLSKEYHDSKPSSPMTTAVPSVMGLFIHSFDNEQAKTFAKLAVSGGILSGLIYFYFGIGM